MLAASSNLTYARGMARALAGALIFGFPLVMTMEMWSLGHTTEPLRLALFLALGLPMLFGLSYYAGFRDTFSWRDDLLDTLAAYAVAVLMSALLLSLLAVLRADMSPREYAGMLAMQSIPAAIGALLARSQMAGATEDDPPDQISARRCGYVSQLFLMGVGAVFVAFNVAPTDEMVVIGFQMTPWHAIAVMGVSIGMLHTFVYSVGLPGQEEGHPSGSRLRTFVHYTVPGYALCLLLSLYILWTFGRSDGAHPSELFKVVIVLGFPASLGAAAARLLV